MAGELPRLQLHTTLVQAFDSARFQDNRFEESEHICTARTEVFLNLLFGRSVVVPAGHIADSPAVATVLREVLAGYEAATARSGPGRALFRIALENGYADYSDYVSRYEDMGVPTVVLPLAEQRRHEARSAILARVKQLYLARDYDTLEKEVHRNGYAEYARLIEKFADRTVTRPRPMPATETDLVGTVEQSVARLDESNGEALAAEIRDALPYFREDPVFRTARGVWYANRDRLGDAWPLVRIWLDQALYARLSSSYDVHHPAYATQEAGPEIARLILPTLEGGEAREAAAQPFSVRQVDWSAACELLADDEFDRRIRELTIAIDRARTSDEVEIAIYRHTEYLAKHFNDLSFDLRQGRVIVQPRLAASTASLVVGSLAGAAAETALGIVLGGFLPMPLVGTVAGGVVGNFVQREAQMFRRQQAAVTHNSNRQVLSDARDRISYWTKPVSLAGGAGRQQP